MLALPSPFDPTSSTPLRWFCHKTNRETMQNQSKRRGGQPGNQNARKGGLYSKHMPVARAEEHAEVIRMFGLYEEIALVRMHIRDLLAKRASSEDVIAAIELLNRLLSTQSRLNH